ncbi:hypothetical protein TRSC58_02990 [Trypanosoma rangeli SC58]|uniref:Uncharacterized protein n=1 Tax=Trypanosoma rangeli SC58 TaxID=429131 RepID=A0A061J7L6_TRYRA|nr:hypothetical protein TRSC58_02990 [Trypanosoma rangeli SC58]
MHAARTSSERCFCRFSMSSFRAAVRIEISCTMLPRAFCSLSMQSMELMAFCRHISTPAANSSIMWSSRSICLSISGCSLARADRTFCSVASTSLRTRCTSADLSSSTFARRFTRLSSHRASSCASSDCIDALKQSEEGANTRKNLGPKGKSERKRERTRRRREGRREVDKRIHIYIYIYIHI